MARDPLSPRCADCGIRHRAVCSRCDAAELARLEQVKFYRSYEAGQRVVWAGDEMAFVGSVVTGVATLSHSLEDGRVQVVGLLMPSDFVGRPGRETAPFDVTAASALTLCCFRRAPFERLMAEMPHVSERLLEMTLDELDAARDWAVVLGRKSARERVASFLASVARREAKLELVPPPRPQRLALPLTREAMADHLGLTLETVSRQLGALARAGAIALDAKRRISILDPARLAAETGDDATAA
ncbi:transcriptional regulator FnrL [Limimaricola pyoseonensis]|uniref:CRP/FNR family transcriptional regulator, anaerobic regulatory protein n=1 Tax=Limimaricola pyoseonensis TaxID=521013 RepID=A0A1G7JJR2_9RHOB|nr:Crp/Fnr family transcriptional regulator [Limimaricola pyoseonensis]SDF25133.1 CRP/FNR family transcriptional regulator, anaerobic regulatory protein [Limimaricola pyoseonensis]